MIPLRLGDIAEVTAGRLVDGSGGACCADLVVDGPVVTDSREARPGSLYIARVGELADGHDYAAAAAAAGAVAAVTTRPLDGVVCVVVPDVQEAFVAISRAVLDALPDLTVIGVTGSSGKTTTKDLLAAVLARHGQTVANVGSLNSEVGVPLTICRVTPTTRYLVLEMGARGVGHIAYLARMGRPSIGVVLNVGSAHVGEFGSRDAIARAKSELVAALPPGGLAVLNGDDPLVCAMATPPGVRVVRVGTTPGNDLRATHVRLDAAGAARFDLHPDTASSEPVHIHLGVLGLHQVGNALAVAAVALHVGMSPVEVGQALGSARLSSRWRMERFERADGVTVINDAYNANPESMDAALHALSHLGAGRRTWAVLGSMLELGPDADEAHRRVGRLTRELGIDQLLVVGPDAAAVLAGAREMSPSTGAVTARFVSDVDSAYGLLEDELHVGDVVLLKSSRDSGLRFLGDRLTHQEVRP